MAMVKGGIYFYSEFLHINILKRDSNLGLSMSHILNYDAAALTTQPPRLEKFNICLICPNRPFNSGQIFLLTQSWNSLRRLAHGFSAVGNGTKR